MSITINDIKFLQEVT